MTAEQVPTRSELLDAIPCDTCRTLTRDPDICWHGTTTCPDCYESLQCRDCAREAVDE